MKIEITHNPSPDATDFANTLAIAYTSRAERLGYPARIVPGGVEIDCDGEAFRYETGIHKWSGISTHDPEKRRVTCFVGVKVEGSTAEAFEQIRHYVTAPYKLATDYRTDIRTNDVDGVLAGNFAEFYGE